jgi:hypothetical protein
MKKKKLKSSVKSISKIKIKKSIIFLVPLVIILVLVGSGLIFSRKRQTSFPQNTTISSPSEQTIVICDTCQGSFGKLNIGVGNTKYTDYLDKQGVKQHGPTTSLWIGGKIFTVHNNETLQVDEYTIFVEEIEVGSRSTGSYSGPPPPVGGGGGLVKLRIKVQ